MLRRSVLPIILLFTAGCDDGLLDPAEQRALAAAEASWQRAALQSYRFEYRMSCFCDPATMQWMRISVQQGAVTEVVYADSTDVVPPLLEGWPTVDELFARIHRLQNDGSAKVDDVTVEFDASLGYPTRISVAMDEDVLDGGVIHMARNLVPATGGIR